MIDQAAEHVRLEASYHCGQDPPLPRWVCLATMNYVRWNLSPARYDFLRRTTGTVPHNTAECLGQQAGICGDHARAFADIVSRFGIETREVMFQYVHSNGAAEGHVACEAFYNNGWHFFGSTWGVVFTDGDHILSIEEVKNTDDPMKLIRYDEVYVDYSSYAVAGLNPLQYVASLKSG